MSAVAALQCWALIAPVNHINNPANSSFAVSQLSPQLLSEAQPPIHDRTSHRHGKSARRPSLISG